MTPNIAYVSSFVNHTFNYWFGVVGGAVGVDCFFHGGNLVLINRTPITEPFRRAV